jgi:hypothetical protein
MHTHVRAARAAWPMRRVASLGSSTDSANSSANSGALWAGVCDQIQNG